jgi:tetratricopeptide (TPR) repeat protein
MPHPVFISYSRWRSVADAQALAAKLGDLAFLDISAIDDGDQFPQHLLDGILDASIVVIFATQAYSESRFCRLEMRLALAAGDSSASHLALALGDASGAVLEAMPTTVASQSWPQADATDRLYALVQRLLANRPHPLRHRLAVSEAQKLSAAFLEESKLPQPQSLRGIVCSLPPGVAEQSIGARFVGRADLLRKIHLVLHECAGGAAQLTSRLNAAGGFGKTRLAIEYMYRYGARYPGGLFWVNAASSDIEGELWRVLYALDTNVPDLAAMRAQRRDVRRELERALRKIGQPALYVIDNIREAAPGSDPPPITDFCPALGAVAVLATSRQDTRESHVKPISVDTLDRNPAILLLTDNVAGAAALSWSDWGRIAEWVGDLPIALDLLNPCLALGSITPSTLLARVNSTDPERNATSELDRLRESLRGQVPKDAVRGITEAFSISFENLDDATRQVALLLAQLAPTPVPEPFMEALPDDLKAPSIRAALHSRHFVTGGDGLSFGVMHRLMADFLCSVAEGSLSQLLERACLVLRQVMTPERCRDPRHWPVMRLCRPHAEALLERSTMHAAAVVAVVLGLEAAILASAQGDYAVARRLEERVLNLATRELGEEHPDTLIAMDNLAETLRLQGDLAGARRLHEKVAEAMPRILGEEHPETLGSMNNLAATLWAQGDLAGARRLQEQVLEARIRLLGEADPRTLTSMCNLAEILRAQGDLAGSRLLQERAAEAMILVLGEEHPDTLAAMNNLAATLRVQGDLAGARRFQERVLEVCIRLLSEEHPSTLGAMNNLAATLTEQGEHTRAQRLQEQVLEASTRVLGEEHPATLTSLGNLAATLQARGDREAAIRLLRRCLPGMRKVLGEEHPTTLAIAKALSGLEAELQGPPFSS